MKKRLTSIFIALLFLSGVAIMAYPTVADMVNRHNAARVVVDYEKSVKEIDKNQYEDELKKANEYNEYLKKYNNINDAVTKESIRKDDTYDNLLNVGGTEVMGTLKIPKIDVNLPIYHGTEESRLQIGIGHFIGSSLPIGGEGTHSVLTGHRGLPSAKLLTEIDSLEKGDKFYIHVLNNVLAYEVDNIVTVLPEDLKDLNIEKGKDYVTLVTCTPYGVNTHRLLVRGVRVPYEEEKEEEVNVEENDDYLFTIYLALILLVIYLIYKVMKNRKKKKNSI